MNTPNCNYCTDCDQVKPIKFGLIEDCPVVEQNHSHFLHKNFKLGHGKEFESQEEAADWLLKRDHPTICNLEQNKLLGGYFVPPYYFSAFPRIIEPENFAKLEDLVMKYKSTPDTENKIAYLDQLKNLAKRKERKTETNVVTDIDLDKCFHQLINAIHGDISESESYKSLKRYFHQNQEEALILHSHKFLVKAREDSPQYLKKSTYNKEKDFIIINLTKGYIAVIDVKYSLHPTSIKKGLDQIKSAKQSLKENLGIEVNQWTFMGFVIGMDNLEMIEVNFVSLIFDNDKNNKKTCYLVIK